MVSASKQFAEVSAKEYANIDHLGSRITWLKIVVAGSFMLELLLSWRLWMGPRTFPKIPLLDIVPETSFYVDVSIFAILLCLLVVIMVHPKPRPYIYAVLFLVGLLAADDQMRWHPYFYQSYFMLAALAFFAWSPATHATGQSQTLALATCRWIVASSYFYAGLQKVNINFVGEIFPWFVHPVTRTFPATEPFLLFTGFAVPCIEMSIAVGLVIKVYRGYAVSMACAMHTFTLFVLGPLGHDWNKIVWPWNISMIPIVFALFWRVEQPLVTSLSVKELFLQKSILCLFVVMPVFSFFDLWDSYLSVAVYSGNTNSAEIVITKTLQQQLPSEVQTYVKSRGKELLLDYFDWSYNELGVATPPETRLFKSIARYLCLYVGQPSDVTLVVYGKPTLFRADQPITYTCATLSY
jgi:uncharacterized membrane protein YphA (DoxX/SURF4 family)